MAGGLARWMEVGVEAAAAAAVAAAVAAAAMETAATGVVAGVAGVASATEMAWKWSDRLTSTGLPGLDQTREGATWLRVWQAW